MDFSIKLYNTDGDTTKDFFSIILCVIYLRFLGLWAWICLKKQAYVRKIHILMGALLVVVSLDLICGPADKRCVKVTGSGDGWDWDVKFYAFKFLRVVLFYTVIVLICVGWSFLMPFLPLIEKMVSLIVILLNVVSIATKDSNPFEKDWRIWERQVIYVPLICPITLAIFYWIRSSWSIKADKADGKAVNSNLIFLHFTAVDVYSAAVSIAKANAVFSKEEWMPNYAIEEILSLVFCMVMFYIFTPAEKNDSCFEFFLRRIEVLRKDLKWALVPTLSQSQSKRSRTLGSVDVSDVRMNIDLNVDKYEIPDVDPPRRRVGRDKAERATKHAEETQRKAKQMEEIQDTFKEHLQLQKEKVVQRREHIEILRRQESAEWARREREEELAHQQQLISDLEILRMPTEGFVGENLEVLLEIQRQIRGKLRKQT